MNKATPRYQPLYKQVKATLLGYLAERRWKPGEAIPNEFRLAEELRVSQGTVRKALDEMAAENLLVRRQGRGTFVTEHDSHRALFHFFKLMPDEGERALPDSQLVSKSLDVATAEDSLRLGLSPAEAVIRLERLRLFAGKPVIHERIALPAQRFPGLVEMASLPNSLYSLYEQRFGYTVAKAEEKLRAVNATANDQRQLDVALGTALLEIDRLAISVDGIPLEWRLSRCASDGYHYLSELF